MAQSLCLFLTFNSKLSDWAKAGILERETKLYKAMAAQGIRVGIFTYGGMEERQYAEYLPGIEIITAYDEKVPRSPLLVAFHSLLFPFWKKKALSAYAVLKSNQMLGAWVPMLTAKLLNKTFLLRCGFELYSLRKRHGRSLWKLWVIYSISKICYQSASRILVTTQEIAEFIQKTYGINSEKISVISNYIDGDLFFPEGKEKRANRVVTVGRLSEEKRPLDMVRAASLGGFALDFVGEGPMKIAIKEMAEKVKADVQFLGKIPNTELNNVLNSYSIYFCASPHEGNPKSLMEACATGMCVVAYDAPGVRTVVESGKNGILVPMLDVSALAKQVRWALDQRQEGIAMGEEGRKRSLAYSFPNVLSQELNLLNSL